MILERYNDPIASIDERNVVAVLVYDLENDFTIDTGIVIAIKQPEQVILDRFVHTEMVAFSVSLVLVV